MENQIENTKKLNYVIWGSVILSALYLLYRKSGFYNQKKLNDFAKKYPGWEINNKKNTTPIKMYAKNFKVAEIEYWLIYYNNGIFRVFTRTTPEKMILEGKWPNDTTFKIINGLKSGKTIKGNTINEMLNKIFDAQVTGI